MFFGSVGGFKDFDNAFVEPFELEPIDFFTTGIDKLNHYCVNVSMIASDAGIARQPTSMFIRIDRFVNSLFLL